MKLLIIKATAEPFRNHQINISANHCACTHKHTQKIKTRWKNGKTLNMLLKWKQKIMSSSRCMHHRKNNGQNTEVEK